MRLQILCLLVLLIFTNTLKAQTFQLTVEDTLILEPDSMALLEAHATVRNTTNAPVRTIVTRQELALATEHVSYFCWGVNCYGPMTSQSPDTIILAAQQENTTFKGYIDPSGYGGASKVRYCFINASNPTDRTCVDFQYKVGFTAAAKPVDPGRTINIPATYDPYSQTIKVNVNGGKIEVWNMLGQGVNLDFRYDGTGMVADASALKTGYYFLFGSTERGPWSARVIVTKN